MKMTNIVRFVALVLALGGLSACAQRGGPGQMAGGPPGGGYTAADGAGRYRCDPSGQPASPGTGWCTRSESSGVVAGYQQQQETAVAPAYGPAPVAGAYRCNSLGQPASPGTGWCTRKVGSAAAQTVCTGGCQSAPPPRLATRCSTSCEQQVQTPAAHRPMVDNSGNSRNENHQTQTLNVYVGPDGHARTSAATQQTDKNLPMPPAESVAPTAAPPALVQPQAHQPPATPPPARPKLDEV